MRNPYIRREDVPSVGATRNPPSGGSGGSDASVRETAWTPVQSAYFLRLVSDYWEAMTPRQRRKLARADVGVYAVVKAIAETRKGL